MSGGGPADQAGDECGGEAGEVEVRDGQRQDLQVEAEQPVAGAFGDEGESGDGGGDERGEDGDLAGCEGAGAGEPARGLGGECDGGERIECGESGGEAAARQPERDGAGDGGRRPVPAECGEARSVDQGEAGGYDDGHAEHDDEVHQGGHGRCPPIGPGWPAGVGCMLSRPCLNVFKSCCRRLYDMI